MFELVAFLILGFLLVCCLQKLYEIENLIKYGTNDPKQLWIEKRKRGEL